MPKRNHKIQHTENFWHLLLIPRIEKPLLETHPLFTLFVSAIIELIPNKTQVNPADNNKVRYAHNEQSNKLFTYFHNNDTLLCTFIPPRPPVILFPFAIFDTIFAATSVVKE